MPPTILTLTSTLFALSTLLPAIPAISVTFAQVYVDAAGKNIQYISYANGSPIRGANRIELGSPTNDFKSYAPSIANLATGNILSDFDGSQEPTIDAFIPDTEISPITPLESLQAADLDDPGYTAAYVKANDSTPSIDGGTDYSGLFGSACKIFSDQANLYEPGTISAKQKLSIVVADDQKGTDGSGREVFLSIETWGTALAPVLQQNDYAVCHQWVSDLFDWNKSLSNTSDSGYRGGWRVVGKGPQLARLGMAVLGSVTHSELCCDSP